MENVACELCGEHDFCEYDGDGSYCSSCYEKYYCHYCERVTWEGNLIDCGDEGFICRTCVNDNNYLSGVGPEWSEDDPTWRDSYDSSE